MTSYSDEEQSDATSHADGVGGAIDSGGVEGDGSAGDHRGTETVVLNSLDGLVSERRSLLVDSQSERLLREAYRSVTTEAARATVEAALESLAGQASTHGNGEGAEVSGDRDSEDADSGNKNGEDAGASSDEEVLADVVADVIDELAARDATLTVDHDVPLDLSAEWVALYNFFGSSDPGDLRRLIDDDAVDEAVKRGAEAVRDGDVETGASAFETAVGESADAETDTAVRILCAWAHHRAGNDETALEFVEDALLRNENAWPARLVGVAAFHNNPSWFREGRLSSRVYLRVRTTIPAAANIDAAVVDGDGNDRWLEGRPECFLTPRLPTDGHVRLRLRGPAGDLPALHAYYMAVGDVEPESFQSRTVEQILLDGPVTAETSERVRIRVP